MKRTDLEWGWKEVIRGLDHLAVGRSRLLGQTISITAHASQAVLATGVAIPTNLREPI